MRVESTPSPKKSSARVNSFTNDVSLMSDSLRKLFFFLSHKSRYFSSLLCYEAGAQQKPTVSIIRQIYTPTNSGCVLIQLSTESFTEVFGCRSSSHINRTKRVSCWVSWLLLIRSSCPQGARCRWRFACFMSRSHQHACVGNTNRSELINRKVLKSGDQKRLETGR